MHLKYVIANGYSHNVWEREREGEREKEKEREGEREILRERKRDRESQGDRETQREIKDGLGHVHFSSFFLILITYFPNYIMYPPSSLPSSL